MSTTNLEDFSPRSNFPYLIGVYLAVNALPDAYLYVDGPDCTQYKAQFIQGKHDLNSTLIDCAGNHRVRMSDVTVNRIIADRTETLTTGIKEMDALPGCALTLLTSMPMATITGTQYDLLVRALRPELEKPLLELPSHSLTGDWLDGYAQTLATIAEGMELEGGNPAPLKAAIVGYLMDRTEQDHAANVDELERMLDGIGLETVSTWLSNRPVDHLQQVRDAGVIISLPHGRAAARHIAARTGATLIETGMPLGLKGTTEWLTGIAAELGLETRTEAFIDRELRSAVPRIQWLIGKYIFGTNVLFSGDPSLFEPLTDFLEELGCRVRVLVAVGKEHHLHPRPDGLKRRNVPILFEANPYELERVIRDLGEDNKIDLAIQSDTFGWRAAGDFAIMPFGCATYWWHAIHDAPYLGYRGALWFVDRIADKLMNRYPRRK